MKKLGSLFLWLVVLLVPILLLIDSYIVGLDTIGR
jgi:hypothetical protein